MEAYEVAIILILTLFFIFYIERLFLFGALKYLLNNSNYNKRKKGQSFWAWLTYKNYKDVLPTKFLVMYYTLLISHLIEFILFAIVVICNLDIEITRYAYIVSLIVNLVPFMYYSLRVYPFIIFGGGEHWDRVLTRTKRNKEKKK